MKGTKKELADHRISLTFSSPLNALTFFDKLTVHVKLSETVFSFEILIHANMQRDRHPLASKKTIVFLLTFPAVTILPL